jgi:hypothetical protein
MVSSPRSRAMQCTLVASSGKRHASEIPIRHMSTVSLTKTQCRSVAAALIRRSSIAVPAGTTLSNRPMVTATFLITTAAKIASLSG